MQFKRPLHSALQEKIIPNLTQQIGDSLGSENFHVRDVLIWNQFVFTMCSITTLTQSKHTRTQYSYVWS